MDSSADAYISYLSAVRRYSSRTCQLYREVLDGFSAFCDGNIVSGMCRKELRNYEVWLMDDRGLKARTVSLHLSVLSGYARYLVKTGVLKSNPVRLVGRPKQEKRLPVFYRGSQMEEYFTATAHSCDKENLELMRALKPGDSVCRTLYDDRLRRLIVSILYNSGMRRSELIGLRKGSVDFSRSVATVRGKGDKMREIPLVEALCEEICLYLKAKEIVGIDETETLLVTFSGRPLYPVYVDRAVKTELGRDTDITGRKSAHVLRHSIATDLLNSGSDLNSIKEMLGHSSLAATQVYTHNSIEKLKTVYRNAHPRAKSK